MASLAQRAECGPHLGREELRLLPGGEVAALVDLVEVREAGVGNLDPAPRGSPDLVGERREADRHGRRRRGLNGEASPCSSVLPIVPGGGGPGARQPVERDVVDDVLPGQVPGRPAVDERAGDLVVAVRVVVEHPGREGDRKSTRLNSSHGSTSYAVFCLQKKKKKKGVRVFLIKEMTLIYKKTI